jgi:predicted RNase H-like nuclease (RuvC/YqgF family)
MKIEDINERVGKYQNALSNLCGVDYAYMQGDPDVDAIIELIDIFVQQMQTIDEQNAEIKVKKKLLGIAESRIEASEMDKAQLKSDIANAEMNLDHLQQNIDEFRKCDAEVKFRKKKIKAEAYKEFWEILKKYLDQKDFVRISEVDDFVKEMVGDKNGQNYCARRTFAKSEFYDK